MLLLVAVIDTLPALTPLTSPDVSTVAMLASLLVHTTGREIGRPRRSCSVTVACVVWPALIVSLASCTWIAARILFGSAERSSLLIPFGAVASEQDTLPSIAKAAATPPVMMRFMMRPMNRAISFTQVVRTS